jgi:hypothetical protein
MTLLRLSYTCKRVDIDTVDAVRSFIDTIEHGCMVVNDHTVCTTMSPILGFESRLCP